jgi:hypothetical protein
MSWQYAVRDIDRAKAKATGIETELTEMGTQDWELVSVMKVTGTIDRYYYKREPPPASLGEKMSRLFHGEHEDDEVKTGSTSTATKISFCTATVRSRNSKR